ncbi:unnamed protein product [Urochloa decumbens]|uniref:Uncharacterized protein n=1 Tax=Urochloa decumbens TaxID=240449 RepID=A0ABC8XYD7_9POAL
MSSDRRFGPNYGCNVYTKSVRMQRSHCYSWNSQEVCRSLHYLFIHASGSMGKTLPSVDGTRHAHGRRRHHEQQTEADLVAKAVDPALRCHSLLPYLCTRTCPFGSLSNPYSL